MQQTTHQHRKYQYTPCGQTYKVVDYIDMTPLYRPVVANCGPRTREQMLYMLMSKKAEHILEPKVVIVQSTSKPKAVRICCGRKLLTNREQLWKSIHKIEQEVRVEAQKVKVQVDANTVVITNDEKWLMKAHEYAKQQQESKVYERLVFSCFNKVQKGQWKKVENYRRLQLQNI